MMMTMMIYDTVRLDDSPIVNVGGTHMRIERALLAAAPVGSLLACVSDTLGAGGEQKGDGVLFVDERPAHFMMMLDCVRHGIDGIDSMDPYDAHIVGALLGLDVPARNSCWRATSTVVLDVGGTILEVATSTLSPPGDRASLLGRMFGGRGGADAHWRPARATPDGPYVLHQNGSHFVLLLDCLRHGDRGLCLLSGRAAGGQDLWGVKCLAGYYGLDGIARTADLLLHEWLLARAPERARGSITVYTRGTLPTLSRCSDSYDTIAVKGRPPYDRPALAIAYSASCTVSRIVQLAACALDAAPDDVIAYLVPFDTRFMGDTALWERLHPTSDARLLEPLVADSTSLYVERLSDAPVPFHAVPFAASSGTHPFVVVGHIVDATDERGLRVSTLGPLVVTDPERPAGLALREAYRPYVSDAEWSDIDDIRIQWGYYTRTADPDLPLVEQDVVQGSLVWIVRGTKVDVDTYLRIHRCARASARD